MSKVKIYQIKDIANTVYAFRNYNKDLFNFDDYALVAEKEIDLSSAEHPAEAVFTLFNSEVKEEFEMRSVSVSDIIEIDGKKYYVNDIGYEELKDVREKRLLYEIKKEPNCYYVVDENGKQVEEAERYTSMDWARLELICLAGLYMKKEVGKALKFGGRTSLEVCVQYDKVFIK